jgi:hypothetical protein
MIMGTPAVLLFWLVLLNGGGVVSLAATSSLLPCLRLWNPEKLKAFLKPGIVGLALLLAVRVTLSLLLLTMFMSACSEVPAVASKLLQLFFLFVLMPQAAKTMLNLDAVLQRSCCVPSNMCSALLQ